MTRELRDYQLEAVEAIEDAWANGCQRPAIVAATGLGKTDIIAALAAKRVRAGRRVLALAHRRELLDQIAERCRMHLPERQHSVAGIVAGEIDQRNRPIVAAMVPTLRNARRRARFEPFGPGDLVIVDEALALDTPVPTPNGWTTIGQVREGDRVLGSTGRPVRVVRKTAIQESAICYRVRFADGTSLVASAGHRWRVRIAEREDWSPRVLTTSEMVARGQRFQVPLSEPWDLDAPELPVPAYLLGLWLGDGTASAPHVTGALEDLAWYAARLPVRTHLLKMRSDRNGRLSFGGDPVALALRALPCWRNKHIPAEYLRASRLDREELLRGLMDSDGYVAPKGSCLFTGTEMLVRQVVELLHSLGQKPSRMKRVVDSRSREGGYWRVSWAPQHGVVPVALPRKVERVQYAVRKTGWRAIESIEEVESVPVQCIEVDAPDHLFLAGEGCAVTHNCHHAGAKTYVDTLEHFGAFDESSGVQAFGVTATMYESGKKYRGLGDVWQKTVFERGLGWAIANEWLVPLQGIAVVADHLDLSKVKTRAGDYSEEQVGELVAQDAEQIVTAWCTYAEDRQTVGFFPTKESVEAARESFGSHRCARHPAGVTCEVVLGDTTQAQRGNVSAGTGIYGRLARGETRVMLGLMVPTEGWDCPPVSCVLMARPTKIDGLYQQMVGRGARLSPATGKRDCLVLDVVGVTRTASLRTLTALLPGVEYRETQPQACARCGKFKRPADRFEPKCICPPEERGIGDRLDLRGLKEPIPYRPVDLLADVDDGDLGEVLWLQTRGGISFIPAKDKLVVLMYERDVGWKAGVVDRDRFSKGERLARGVSDYRAKELAERWVRENVEPTYWQRNAPWRRKREIGSEGQLRAARHWGIEAPESYTKAALSDLISIRAASRRLDR